MRSLPLKRVHALAMAASIAVLGAAPAWSAAAEPGKVLLAPWIGPYGGVPPLDQVKVSDFQPAMEAAMAAERREIAAIAGNPAPPSFDNTILAYERAGRALTRVSTVYNIWSGNLSTTDFQAVEKVMAPKLAALRDEINQNAALFKRIEAVYQSPDLTRRSPEQQRLVWLDYTTFVQQGARLNAADKARMAAINQRLATLYTQFSQNELADEEGHSLVITNAADLAGLPATQVDSAAAQAKAQGLTAGWAIANTRSAMETFLTYSANRALREKGWQMWTRRGDNGDAHDNNAIVTEILALRAERSKLLGFPTFAHWQLAENMAKEPKRAMDLMLQVWQPALARVKAEVAQMQALVDAERGGFKIQPWDYRYYAEKVRQSEYDFDSNQLAPYLQLDHIREAMFWAAGQLYGFRFVPVKDVPVFHPDVTVYEVLGRDGHHVGLWYFDPYARPGKSSGAWMNAYRDQERLDGPVSTIVSNNSNFVKGAPGQPVLLSWDDASTMFHEFGHALHGLNSNVTYPSLSGTNTARDFVEFPSQLNEHWLSTPEVMKFLVDAKGQPLPAALVAKQKRAQNYGEGFRSTEYLASALVDMKLHLAGDAPIDPRAFEQATLKELGMPSEIVMRHRIPQFGHVFSGEGYAAGYYGYLWAEVLDHDAFEAFTEAGGPYDPVVAQRLHDTIMSVGNTVDPAKAFRNFRGRDPKVDALLRERGFPVPPAQ